MRDERQRHDLRVLQRVRARLGRHRHANPLRLQPGVRLDVQLRSAVLGSSGRLPVHGAVVGRRGPCRRKRAAVRRSGPAGEHLAVAYESSVTDLLRTVDPARRGPHRRWGRGIHLALRDALRVGEVTRCHVADGRVGERRLQRFPRIRHRLRGGLRGGRRAGAFPGGVERGRGRERHRQDAQGLREEGRLQPVPRVADHLLSDLRPAEPHRREGPGVPPVRAQDPLDLAVHPLVRVAHRQHRHHLHTPWRVPGGVPIPIRVEAADQQLEHRHLDELDHFRVDALPS